MADLIRRKKLNAVMTAPNILHSLARFFSKVLFLSPGQQAGPAADVTPSPVSCFTL